MALIPNLPSGVYERDQSAKQYHKVLLVGGRLAQSPEINEIQQIQDSQRYKLATSIFQEGTIISGGYASQDSSTKEIVMKETKILLKEYIFVIESTVVTPNVSGESTVGILLTMNYIRPEDDPELLSPVEGVVGYGSKGGMRIQYLTQWIAEPTSDLEDNQYYYPLYTTVDGLVISSQSKSSSEIYDTIARYDNDSNGSYVISGMSAFHSRDSEDSHICGISEGVAHVNGYEVVFSHSKQVVIPKATDVFSRISEPIATTGSTGLYKLRHTPIAEVSRLLVTKRRVKVPFTHDNYSGASDSLIKTSNTGVDTLNTNDSSVNTETIVAITKIVGVYSKADDSGITYSENRDYLVNGHNIDWSPSGPEEPDPGETYYVTLEYITNSVTPVVKDITDNGVTYKRAGLQIDDPNIVVGGWCAVDYSHYLERVDTIVLYSDSSISVIKGAPVEYNPSPQSVSGGLVLSTVLVSYDEDPYFFRDYFKAMRMSEILEMKNAIETLQANLAQLDLKTDISSREPSTTRAGMFVDPFYDNDQRDEGLEQNAEIVDQTLYPKRDWAIYEVHSGKSVTLDKSEVLLYNQKFRTKSRLINEFSVMSDNPVARVTVSPSVYRWAADFTTVSRTQWISSGSARTETTVQLTDIDKVYDVPPFTITVSGEDFNASEQVKISVGSVLVKTVTADSKGSFSTTITTPNSMKSGTSQIQATGVDSTAIGISSISTIPQRRTTTRTTYNVTVRYNRDPIGQTFLNEEMCLVSSISLLFAVKPEAEVTVALCETSSGYPDPTKILAVAYSPNGYKNISTSNWTKFTFDSPAVLEANTYYSFIVISDESAGQVYTAELGKRDNWNNFWMTKNVFSAGTLVQASQLFTWSAIQSEDLTFQIYRCKFSTGTKEITLGTITIPNYVNELYLMADSEVFADTSIEYKAVLDGDYGSYYIQEYNSLTLPSKYKGKVKVVATLSSLNSEGKLSPKINGDVQLAAAIPVFPSEYISRAFPADNKFMKVYLDVKETGTQITLQYQNASTGVWTALETDNTLYPPLNVGDGWVTRTYFKDLGDYGVNKGLLRIKIVFNDTGATTIPAARNLRVLTMMA